MSVRNPQCTATEAGDRCTRDEGHDGCHTWPVPGGDYEYGAAREGVEAAQRLYDRAADDFPWTGFTLKLDGEPEALGRVHAAMSREMAAILEERRVRIGYTLPTLEFGFHETLLWPFSGSIAVRGPRIDMADMPL